MRQKKQRSKISIEIIKFLMKKKLKNIKSKTSISSLFAKKYIYYYYAFFWFVLVCFLILNQI